jgi:hypothetical protein
LFPREKVVLKIHAPVVRKHAFLLKKYILFARVHEYYGAVFLSENLGKKQKMPSFSRRFGGKGT